MGPNLTFLPLVFQSELFSLEDVGQLIQELLGDFYSPHYLTEPRLRGVDVDALLGVVQRVSVITGLTTAQALTSGTVTGQNISQLTFTSIHLG